MSVKFEGSSFAIVTGVTRGFGLSVCEEMCKSMEEGSVVVMVGRNEVKMNESAQKVKNVCSKNIQVAKVVFDLSNLAGIQSAVDQCFSSFDLSNYKNFFLVNNAATLGDTGPFTGFLDHQKVSNFFDLNLSSFLLFTSNVLNKIKPSKISNKFLVNITSLCALKPQTGCSMYCAAKSAREMLFKVVAGENPGLRVLSWSPGVMNTDMLDEWMCNKVGGEGVEFVKKVRDEGKCVGCDESAVKMLQVLKCGQFENGAHIDYYDV